MWEKQIKVSINYDVILPDDYEIKNGKKVKKTHIFLDNGTKRNATEKDYIK